MDRVLDREVGSIQVFEAILQTFEVRETKTGNPYGVGNLHCFGETIPFKVWSGAAFEYMEGLETGCVVSVKVKVDEYKGAKSVVITECVVIEEAQAFDYLASDLDKEELTQSFTTLLGGNLSSAGKRIFKLLYSTLNGRFVMEVASVSGFHDGVKHGLLNHSLKVLKFADLVWNTYPELHDKVNKDVFYLGTALHDMGKVVEYNGGVMSAIGSLVSHRLLAIEVLSMHRDEVIKELGSENYYRLMSIFGQHHGEYEETPRTIEAFMVHQVDALDAAMTGLIEKVVVGGNTRYSGFILS